MANNGAPGVTIIERDFSQRIENVSNVAFATMGFFVKGPVNEPININTRQDFLDIFGTPDDLSSQFWFPIAKILEVNNNVWVTRVEDSEKLCAGVTVGTALQAFTCDTDRVYGETWGAVDISSGDTVKAINPQKVSLYPLTYGALSEDSAVSICTALSASGLSGSGFLEATEVGNQVSVFAVGPGKSYHQSGFAIVNADDYAILRDISTHLASAYTDEEQVSLANDVLGVSAYPVAYGGSSPDFISEGLTPELGTSIITYRSSIPYINNEMLQSYLQFEFSPRVAVPATGFKAEFCFYEYLNGTVVSAVVVSPNPVGKDSNGINNFANNVVNNASSNIRLFVGTSESTAKNVVVPSVAYTLLAGADDLSTDLSTLEGEFMIQLSTNYANKLGIQFNAFVDTGFSTPVKQRMDSIANTRKDCVALLNVASSTMINVETGAKTSKPTNLIKEYVETTLGIASSYSGIYANYFEVYDEFNEKYRWVPCTGHVANRLAYTFDNFAEWFAYAGFERGVIDGVNRVAYNPSDEQQKILYTNRINPIVQFPGEGTIIMGNKTLQAYASNSDRLNCRHLIIKIGRDVAKFARTILFAQNDELTRAQFRSQANPYLQGILQRRGLVDYRVVCDETNNPPEVVFAHEFVAWLLIKPTPTAEFVKITIANVGGTLSFDEVISRGGL
jgi:phage tail sheath protein FI